MDGENWPPHGAKRQIRDRLANWAPLSGVPSFRCCPNRNSVEFSDRFGNAKLGERTHYEFCDILNSDLRNTSEDGRLPSSCSQGAGLRCPPNAADLAHSVALHQMNLIEVNCQN